MSAVNSAMNDVDRLAGRRACPGHHRRSRERADGWPQLCDGSVGSAPRWWIRDRGRDWTVGASAPAVWRSCRPQTTGDPERLVLSAFG